MKHPPSFYEDRLRQEPNGYLYDVITNGFGAMYSYSAQIPPADRWAIVAYVRALQLSRNARVGELPAELREKLMAQGAAK
jgi:Cytochrome C oxidase, cbb3-type, subunit III